MEPFELVAGIGLIACAWLIDDTARRYGDQLPALGERRILLHRSAIILAVLGAVLVILAFLLPRL